MIVYMSPSEEKADGKNISSLSPKHWGNAQKAWCYFLYIAWLSSSIMVFALWQPSFDGTSDCLREGGGPEVTEGGGRGKNLSHNGENNPCPLLTAGQFVISQKIFAFIKKLLSKIVSAVGLVLCYIRHGAEQMENKAEMPKKIATYGLAQNEENIGLYYGYSLYSYTYTWHCRKVGLYFPSLIRVNLTFLRAGGGWVVTGAQGQCGAKDMSNDKDQRKEN